MGSFASQFQAAEEEQVIKFTHPNKPDWITAHARKTGLSVIEVSRLWMRFQQLGCTQDGLLPKASLQNPPASEDVFAKNILAVLMAPKDNVSFQTFLNCMSWGQSATILQKVKAIFSILNRGKPVNKELLQKVLMRVYPDHSEEDIEVLCGEFFQKVDPDNKGEVTEEMFTRFIKSLPVETLHSVLDFHIIPPELSLEADVALSRQGGHSTLPHSQPEPSERPPVDASQVLRPASTVSVSHQIPTDKLLHQVAERARRRDWYILANRLGFTQEDIDGFERQHRRDTSQQIWSMLKEWRSREGQAAHIEVLEKALRSSNMNDIAIILYP